eukprot:TRINITY_DN9300_c0_g3_i1.p1 TRINITY_DN9300_c0_g3~~TRINITY_DN9300_c0_g3_i1.p1  ORF type:complete len:407 (+),score=34.68 TRINITY_DN9300_c0_g3_i1:83-1222(+)
MSELLVYWRSGAGSPIPVEVQSTATLADLKAAIAAVGGPSEAESRVCYGTDVLTDECATLADHGICMQAHVELVIAPTRRTQTVSAGAVHSLALLEDGTVRGWGGNSDTQLDIPDFGGRRVVSLGQGCNALHSGVILDDGSVSTWGSNEYGQTDVPSLSGLRVTAIAVGWKHSAAVLENGAVTCWGYNRYGQSEVPPAHANTVFVSVAVGGRHTVGLAQDGQVAVWGDSHYNQTEVPPTIGRCVMVAAGYSHTVAVQTDGTIVAWGSDRHQQVSSIPRTGPWRSIVAMACGTAHTCAITDSGLLLVWGDPKLCEDMPADVSGSSVAAGEYHCVVATQQGTVVCWGENDDEYGTYTGQSTAPDLPCKVQEPAACVKFKPG